MSNTIKYSTNPAIIAGMDKDEAGKKSRGWEFTSIEWDQVKIENMIRSQAYIGSELKDGHKTKANVKAIYNIILDFDSGHPSLKDFLFQAKNYRFCWICHTTVNHQKNKVDSDTQKEIPGTAKDKFRVIIPLTEAITEDALAQAAKTWCSTKRFPTLDPTSFQGSRYFMVNPDAEVHIHDAWLNPMAQPGEESEKLPFLDPFEAGIIPESYRKNAVGRPKSKSKEISGIDDGDYSLLEKVVKLADGTEKKIGDINEKTPVLCPFCDPSHRQHPDKHNAFVDWNKAGQQFLHCSSEHKTYWSHSSEIDASRSSLFFNETIGYASRIIEDEKSKGYVHFKNNDDWLNYCQANNIKPSVKIFLPRLSIVFDPTRPSGLQKEYFNMFQESEYLQLHNTAQSLLSDDEVLQQMEQQTPVINEIMMNIFGDKEYLKRFLNWNAVILKERMKLDTAWLITSKEQGIGKGLIFDRVLQPIFGKRQSVLVPGERMAKNFNAQDQTIWLKVFDEVFAPGNHKENLSRKEWLKYIITAREQTIELKGIDAFQMDNHMNLILYSNNECPIFLDNQDRRFSVIRNETAVKTEKLSFYKNNLDMRERIDAELSDFVDLLLNYPCDVELANKAVDSAAKNNLQEITADEYEEFAKALRNRDESYFLLNEIFPPSAQDKMFTPDVSMSAEGREVESAIQEGYVPSKNMGRICKYHFSNSNYKNITARLRLKGIEKMTKKVNGVSTSVYMVR